MTVCICVLKQPRLKLFLTLIQYLHFTHYWSLFWSKTIPKVLSCFILIGKVLYALKCSRPHLKMLTLNSCNYRVWAFRCAEGHAGVVAELGCAHVLSNHFIFYAYFVIVRLFEVTFSKFAMVGLFWKWRLLNEDTKWKVQDGPLGKTGA